jgi:hypothetical protein
MTLTDKAPEFHKRAILAAERLAPTSKAAAKKYDELRAAGAQKGWNN